MKHPRPWSRWSWSRERATPQRAMCRPSPPEKTRSSTWTTVQKGVSILCHANGGTRLDGGNPVEPIEIPTPQTHFRLNTPIGTDLFARDGYTLIGWNTRPDGSGESVGLGSRIAWEDGLTLYA